MNRLSKVIFTIKIGLLVIFTSGCGYITGSITDIVGDIVPQAPLTDKIQTAEVTSGAIPEQVTTPSGYRVQASVGSFVDEVYLVTPGNSYKVYQGVQGQVLSE